MIDNASFNIMLTNNIVSFEQLSPERQLTMAQTLSAYEHALRRSGPPS